MTPAEYSFYVFTACFFIFIVPGPIFFLSINEGIHGLRGGFMMILGVLTAQSILLAFLDIGFIILLQRILTILRITGAILLVVLGGSAIRNGIRSITSSSYTMAGTPYSRGFLLTFLNPPFILWFVSVGSALLETGITELGSLAYIIFGLILLASSVLVMSTIILSVHGGKSLIGKREIRVMYIVSGMGFIIIAITLFIPLFYTLTHDVGFCAHAPFIK